MTCTSCGTAIRWAKTGTGRAMPVNANDGVSHFISCPFAAHHRHRKQS